MRLENLDNSQSGWHKPSSPPWEWRNKTFTRALHRKVIGQEDIPANRQLIVVSNHCSHLDMGLVKHALGSYGRKMVALAAKDYFFEGSRLGRRLFRSD